MPRRRQQRHIAPRTVIVCGTEKTEPLYFNDYKRHLKKCGIHIEGVSVLNTKTKYQSPDKLLEYALEKSHDYDLDFESGDSIWCVFDYDDFGSIIEQSVNRKKYNNIKKIISSRCFELWYLLHYKYTTKFISNTEELEEELSKLLGEKYKKNISYFNRLISNQDDAIQNAKKLESYHEETGNRRYSNHHNPFTDVYKLVEYLNNVSSC
ncbi:RloB domain-containing protein [Fusibacter paucivorans]|uniref:RloB domain-containing protein n=1 Tax=Fusibacter paucivorans TaxID=76009 RepID=A0ABS5PVY4_9FIRM|nr:RloB family protein [Fusibacter paucivorans]MBS7528754.1 RloB domain-containing protein [Fusibacter paucivorans]